jgi:hypothetical protein
MCRLLDACFAGPDAAAGSSVGWGATVIDDDRRRNAIGLLMRLNMLIETPAGFDYTRPPTARPACERPASATPTSNISRGRTR